MNSRETDRSGRKNAFVHKLYAMLEDESLKNMIWWTNFSINTDSRQASPVATYNAFTLQPNKEFSECLKQYFKHGNVASFVRQLHMYGFHKVTEGINEVYKPHTPEQSDRVHSSPISQAAWMFTHSSGLFRKGDELSLVHIKRRPGLSSGKRHMQHTYVGQCHHPVASEYYMRPNSMEGMQSMPYTFDEHGAPVFLQYVRPLVSSSPTMVFAPQPMQRELHSSPSPYCQHASPQMQYSPHPQVDHMNMIRGAQGQSLIQVPQNPAYHMQISPLLGSASRYCALSWNDQRNPNVHENGLRLPHSPASVERKDANSNRMNPSLFKSPLLPASSPALPVYSSPTFQSQSQPSLVSHLYTHASPMARVNSQPSPISHSSPALHPIQVSQPQRAQSNLAGTSIPLSRYLSVSLAFGTRREATSDLDHTEDSIDRTKSISTITSPFASPNLNSPYTSIPTKIQRHLLTPLQPPAALPLNREHLYSLPRGHLSPSFVKKNRSTSRSLSDLELSDKNSSDDSATRVTITSLLV